MAGEIRVAGGQADAMVLDVTDTAAVTAALAAADPFDLVVNNTGTDRPPMLPEVTEEDYDAIARLNLKTAYFVAQAVARRMAATRGSIIYI